MLVKCPECLKDISDSAPSCPHCGYVVKPAGVSHGEIDSRKRTLAIFQFVSLGAIVIALFTPRMLVTLPCLVIISAGIIALVRKEPRWVLSLGCTIAGLYLIAMSTPDLSSRTEYIGKMELQNWDWQAESNYTHIRGRVKNTGNKTVRYFKIQGFYKDASGNVLDTDFTNSSENLMPGMSKEFEITHRQSPDYKHMSISVVEAHTQ